MTILSKILQKTIDMRLHQIVLILSLLFFCKLASGQTTFASALKLMFADQKNIYKAKPKSIRKEYKTLTDNIPVLQHYLLSELPFLDSTKLPNNLEVNIFEATNQTYGNIYGVLWWGEEFYEFAVQGKITVKKKKYSALTDDNKKVVSSFSDWNSTIFQQSEYNSSMSYRGDDVCQVYLASKYDANVKPIIRSIGFYY